MLRRAKRKDPTDEISWEPTEAPQPGTLSGDDVVYFSNIGDYERITGNKVLGESIMKRKNQAR